MDATKKITQRPFKGQCHYLNQGDYRPPKTS